VEAKSKESMARGLGFGPPQSGLLTSFLHAAVCSRVLEWSSFAKYQIRSTKSQDVRCRVSGVRIDRPEH
jgi:hypothetical protein